MEEEIFRKCTIDTNKLLAYGFIKNNDIYTYEKNILDNTFKVVITITNNKVKGKIIDKEIDDEYLGFRVENHIGEFASVIREEFKRILIDIKDCCALESIYTSTQANRIAKKVKEKYGDSLEFLWDNDNNSVFRNKNNKKWYAAIMYINKNKIANEDKMIEVMNVKLSKEKVENKLSQKGYYKAYHMNKKYWITLLLDNTLSDEEIMQNIEESYNYTVETNEWVIPANPKYFDVISYVKSNETIEWHQPTNININDIVYLYLGSPYSCIMYKFKVLEKDIEREYDKKAMRLELLNVYDKNKYKFEELKKYDLNAIRGARRMPIKLINKMKEDEKND